MGWVNQIEQALTIYIIGENERIQIEKIVRH